MHHASEGRKAAGADDGRQVLATPVISEPITGGHMMLYGDTADVTKKVAVLLNLAAGDWPFRVVEARRT